MAMCEAGQHLTEVTFQGRSGAVALFAGDHDAVAAYAAAARAELDTARTVLDGVRDPAYRGGPTWNGLLAASNSASDALDSLGTGNATEATRHLDVVIGQLDAVSPPLPETCIA